MRLITLIAITVLVSTQALAGNNLKLKNLNNNINQLKTTIDSARQRLSSTQHKLAIAETKLGSINKRLHNTNKKLQKSRNSINSLESGLQQSRSELKKQQSALQDQLKHIYYLGRQPALKALLEHNNDETARFLVYFQKLNADIKLKISGLNQTLQKISNNQTKQQLEYKKLKHLQQQIKSDHSAQSKTLNKRQHLMRQLNIVIANKKEQLSTLLNNKRALEDTIYHLAKNNYQTADNLSKLQGKLPWPVPGKITQTFNATIAGSQLRTNGIVISGKAGQPVRAVAAGKIIFSRWLAGYGLLIIVDHGHGYMSLYGRNSSLLKTVGNTVNKGEIIAESGQTGGYNKPGLYFAIRHDGKSINPARWCS